MHTSENMYCIRSRRLPLTWCKRNVIKARLFSMIRPHSKLRIRPLLNTIYFESSIYEGKCMKSSKIDEEKQMDLDNFENCNDEFRKNPLQIQMLSKGLYNQVFQNSAKKTEDEPEEEDENIRRSVDHLKIHGLWGKKSSVMKDINFELPKLKGANLMNHLLTIGENQTEPYKKFLKNLLSSNIPEMPSSWVFSEGWTKYYPDGKTATVPHPDCDALVFDVEVCVNQGQQPTLATAVSKKYWYSWCSRSLVDKNYQLDCIRTNDLIPMEDLSKIQNENSNPSPRIIVGHNVSYDRIRIREQYSIKKSSLRFLDTMSLNIAVCGLVFDQRVLLMKNKSLKEKIWVPWMKVGCQNSLKDCYKFHCQGNLEKDDRNVFVKGDLNDIRSDFQNLMKYCAGDVIATYKLLGKLLPTYFNRFPHPVSFAGMLEMGSTFLPITSNWNKYTSSSEKEYFECEDELNGIFVRYAREALSFKEDDKYKRDVWLWNLDWALPKVKVKKLQNYPNWYRKLCRVSGLREGTPEPEKMSTGLKIIPKLLKLTWNGFPLHFESKYGWGYLKPTHSKKYKSSEFVDCVFDNKNLQFPLGSLHEMCPMDPSVMNEVEEENFFDDDDIDWEQFYSGNSVKKSTKKISNSNAEREIDIGIPGVLFSPLPHKNGPSNKVGNPLAKDFLRKFEEKVMSSHISEVAELVLRNTKTLSYWRNNRDRILSQLVVWPDHKFLPKLLTESGRNF